MNDFTNLPQHYDSESSPLSHEQRRLNLIMGGAFAIFGVLILIFLAHHLDDMIFELISAWILLNFAGIIVQRAQPWSLDLDYERRRYTIRYGFKGFQRVRSGAFSDIREVSMTNYYSMALRTMFIGLRLPKPGFFLVLENHSTKEEADARGALIAEALGARLYVIR